MPCSCGRTECECEGVCHCCPFMCLCQQCFEIRRRLGAYCGPCGGHMTTYVCSMMPEWRRTGQYPNYPNLDFLNIHTHQPSSSASDERAHTRSAPEATESSSTASRRSAPEATESSSTASRRSAPEPSQSRPRESDTFDIPLMFQMDDIDPPSPVVTTNTSTGAKSRDFHGSSHFSSNTSVSDYMPFELREQPSRFRRCYDHSPAADSLKATESPKCKMLHWTPLHASQSVDECASDSLPSKLHSGDSSPSNILVSPRSPTSPLLTSEHQSTCELQFSEQKKSLSVGTSPTSNLSEFETLRISDSRPIDDSPPSNFLVSPRSPTNPLSTSEHQSTCELQSSEQKETLSVGTSPTSNLSEFETLRISDSRPIDKSSFESSSVDILPENRPNEERYDALHGQPDIPSLSVASSQLNNTAVQAESSQSSKSDSSTETISRERTDKSDDEAPTNKSPKEK